MDWVQALPSEQPGLWGRQHHSNKAGLGWWLPRGVRDWTSLEKSGRTSQGSLGTAGWLVVLRIHRVAGSNHGDFDERWSQFLLHTAFKFSAQRKGQNSVLFRFGYLTSRPVPTSFFLCPALQDPSSQTSRKSRINWSWQSLWKQHSYLKSPSPLESPKSVESLETPGTLESTTNSEPPEHPQPMKPSPVPPAPSLVIHGIGLPGTWSLNPWKQTLWYVVWISQKTGAPSWELLQKKEK